MVVIVAFDEIKQKLIDLALLGASPAAIAYDLQKDGFEITAEQVLQLIEQWQAEIELEQELRTIRSKQQLSDIIRRLESLLVILEKLLQETMSKKKSKVSVEAIKEMHQIIAKIYELISEARAKEEAEKLISAKNIKSVYQYVLDNFADIVKLVPEDKLAEAGLARVDNDRVQ